MAGCFPVWILLSWSRKRSFRLGNLILDLRVPGWQKSSGAVLPAPDQSHDWYRPVGLLPDVKYHFYGRNIKYNLKDFGDLVNTVSPVHIKQGSALQEILSRFVNMDGEKEELTAYGDTLMRAGIALKPAFAGTGYNSDTRLFPDFSSRIYFMEAAE